MRVQKTSNMWKNCIWNPGTGGCKNGKSFEGIIDGPIITCDELIEEIKSLKTNFNEKEMTYKTKKNYILLVSLLITIAFLIAVNIQCYSKKSKYTMVILRQKLQI